MPLFINLLRKYSYCNFRKAFSLKLIPLPDAVSVFYVHFKSKALSCYYRLRTFHGFTIFITRIYLLFLFYLLVKTLPHNRVIKFISNIEISLNIDYFIKISFYISKYILFENLMIKTI